MNWKQAGILLLVIAVIFFISSCASMKNKSDYTSQEESRSSDETGKTVIVGSETKMVTDYSSFLQYLRALVTVKEIGTVERDYFSASGRIILIGKNEVQIFEYKSESFAKLDAKQISEDGYTIRDVRQVWAAPPHFYQEGKLIVLYLGNEQDTLHILEDILGKQIAGS